MIINIMDMKTAERPGQVNITLASYWGGPEFIPRPVDRLY